MPSFSISNQDPKELERQKKKALSKAKVSKPKPRKSSPRSTVTLSDISGINNDLGSSEYKSLWKDPDIILHCNGITLDGIHLLSGFNEREAEWGILYIGAIDIENNKVAEYYKLFQFKPRINLDNLGDLQQVWRFSSYQDWEFKSDDEWFILREISRIICNILGKRMREDKHSETMNYMKVIRETQTIEDEPGEIEKPKGMKSFSDGKPVTMDLDF